MTIDWYPTRDGWGTVIDERGIMHNSRTLAEAREEFGPDVREHSDRLPIVVDRF